MGVLVKFLQSGAFNSGEFKSLDLDKITKFEIKHLRNSCELLAITPENPQQNLPYVIAQRDKEYKLEDILKDLQQLKQEKKDIIYEITATDVRKVNKI